MAEKRRDLRGQLNRLVAGLPDADVRTTLRFVEAPRSLRDSVLASLLAAPPEDEELGAEELEAIRAGDADIEGGRIHTAQTIERDFGL